MQLSEKLKELRNKNNFNQEDVAKMLQIHRVTYTNYEIGRRKPDLETLIKLAELYNCSVDYLLGRYNK